MTEARTDEATVLVVEDERHLADLYAEYLIDSYDVVTAYGGEEGMERLTDDVDVVLLDRRMPVLSGSEALATIKERDVDCRVAMVTSTVPDVDLVERGVDDYLVKPVTREEALAVVDRLLAITEYTETLRELTSKKLTRNVLRVERSRTELQRSERYRELEADIGRLQSSVDELERYLDLEDVDLAL